MAQAAELERGMIRERQREGIKLWQSGEPIPGERLQSGYASAGDKTFTLGSHRWKLRKCSKLTEELLSKCISNTNSQTGATETQMKGLSAPFNVSMLMTPVHHCYRRKE